MNIDKITISNTMIDFDFKPISITIFNDSDEILYYWLNFNIGSTIRPHESVPLILKRIMLLTFTLMPYRSEGIDRKYSRSIGFKENMRGEIHVKFENDDIVVTK